MVKQVKNLLIIGFTSLGVATMAISFKSSDSSLSRFLSIANADIPGSGPYVPTNTGNNSTDPGSNGGGNDPGSSPSIGGVPDNATPGCCPAGASSTS